MRWQVQALGKVAEALAQAADPLADIAFKEALDAARSVPDPEHTSGTRPPGELTRPRAIGEVLAAMVRVGRKEEALEAAYPIAGERTRSEVLREIAEALAHAGSRQEALEAAYSIPDEWAQRSALHEVALALARAGCYEEAVRVARSQRDRRDWTLHEVARVLAKAKDGRAAKVLLEAFEAIRDSPDGDAQPWAVHNVARALAQAGHRREAVKVAYSLSDPRAQARTLGEVVIALTKARRYEEAVEVARSVTNKATWVGILPEVREHVKQWGTWKSERRQGLQA